MPPQEAKEEKKNVEEQSLFYSKEVRFDEIVAWSDWQGRIKK